METKACWNAWRLRSSISASTPLLADALLRDPRHHLVAAIADDRLVGFVSALDYWHLDKPRELGRGGW